MVKNKEYTKEEVVEIVNSFFEVRKLFIQNHTKWVWNAIRTNNQDLVSVKDIKKVAVMTEEIIYVRNLTNAIFDNFTNIIPEFDDAVTEFVEKFEEEIQ